MKAVLLIISLLISGSACAEWTLIHSNRDADFYFDFSTIRKEANFRKIWGMASYKIRPPTGEMSFRARKEFDCKEERYRFINLTVFDEPMTKGKILSNSELVNGWNSIAPETVDEVMFKVVCAK